MKKITYTIGFAFAVLASSNAVAQQGFGTNRPNKSAAVEIKSINKGLLVPRVELTGPDDKTTIANPANSLLVYNLTEANALSKGYYFFDRSNPDTETSAVGKWVPILDGNKITSGNGTLIKFDSNTGKAKIDLGGTLTEKVEIETSDSNTFALQGLKEVTSLGGKNVLISDTATGVIETVAVKTLLDSSTVNELYHYGADSSTLNKMVSIVNGNEASAEIILKNELSIPSSADTATNTSIISKVNGVESNPINLKEIIKAGETEYKVISSDSSVTVTPTQGNDLVTYDISVAATQAKNGLSMDTATGAVVLGGVLDRNTIINADTNTLAITGLKEDTSTSNFMVVVDNNGVLKKAEIGSNNAVKYISGPAATFNIVSETEQVETIIVNSDSGTQTIILPMATDGNSGKRYYIKKAGNSEKYPIVITTENNSGKIDGLDVSNAQDPNGGPIESTLLHQSWIFQSGGSTLGWFIVGQ